MLDLQTVGPEFTRPACCAAAADIDRYLLQACARPQQQTRQLPRLLSMYGTDRRTDGRTVCRFMTLIKYYAERVTTCEVAAAAAVAADTSLLTTHQYSSAGGTMTNACRATNYQRHCWLATLPHAPSQFALPSHRRFPPYGPPRPPSFLVAVRGRQPGHPPDPFGRTSSADCRPHGYLGYCSYRQTLRYVTAT